jgi:hypothetical protein
MRLDLKSLRQLRNDFQSGTGAGGFELAWIRPVNVGRISKLLLQKAGYRL